MDTLSRMTNNNLNTLLVNNRNGWDPNNIQVPGYENPDSQPKADTETPKSPVDRVERSDNNPQTQVENSFKDKLKEWGIFR